ncbi:MAG: cupin domain-containing protein [Burkholderiales bacterium]|nr:cupin domain-containing protein [Burkholderiales bacterium]
MSQPEHPALLSAEAIAALHERTHRHAFNPNGVRQTRALSDACGMTQLGVHLVRLEPGRESTEYHTHSHDEEWIYIVSGRASAEIGGRKAEVKAGDFMGFVAGSLPHTLFNDSSQDLVYLVGGTRHGYDVVDYPRRGVRSYRYDGKRDNVATKHLGGI